MLARRWTGGYARIGRQLGMAGRPSPPRISTGLFASRVSRLLSTLALLLLGSSVLAPAAGPATPNPMCPHLDTWNPRGIKGPNRIDNLIVRFPVSLATQRGGTCSVMVEASYNRERERSYSFLTGGQFLVNVRFSRSPDRDSAVSGTRAFFLFPRPRRLTLESRTTGGTVTVRLDPVRVVQVGS
jgi:hypothetical protein